MRRVVRWVGMAAVAVLVAAVPGTAKAQQTLYVINANAGTSGFQALQDGGTAPTPARLATGWTAGTAPVGTASPLDTGVTQAQTTFATPITVPNGTLDNTTGDAFRTQNAYNGSFAATTWTITTALQARTTAYDGRMRMRFRVFASTDGTGATKRELTAVTLTSTNTTVNVPTTGTTSVTATWNPGAITLTNEYLFFEAAAETMTAGTSTAGNYRVYVGSGFSAITTPVYTAVVPVTGVTISPTPTVTVHTGATQQFTASVAPLNATNQSVTWSVTGGASCGSVSTSGLYTAPAAVATGCGVTVTTADGGFQASTSITLQKPVTSVAISPLTPTVNTGATQQFTATITPADATNTSVTWSVTGTSCGSIDTNGLYTAPAAMATGCGVTVTSVDDNTKTASTSIILTSVPVAVTGVAISPTPSVTLNTSATQQFTATVAPANATNKSVTWTVLGTGCGSVTTGGLYTAPAAAATGCSVRVTTVDGGFTASTTIAFNVAVTGVAIGPSSATVSVNATQQFSATIAPADATNKNVTWSVVGAGCGTVSAAGLYTAPAATTSPCSVRVTSVDGGFTSDATITLTNFIGDGDTIGGSTKPVISIINPMSGAVLTQPARVQVRIFSPGGAPLLTGVDAPKLLVDGANPGAAVTAVGQMTAYPGSTTNVVGVWEFTLNTLTSSAAGIAHTLRATASNAGGLVYSGTITVVIKTGKGDGNLLVRDDSSQICSDCHAGAMSHSSESTGDKFGSWATTCRDCHTPHKTTNISLIRTSIKPPERTGATTAQPVVFLNRSGYATSSFASTAKNGVCQVCHTATGYYRADGTLATHETAANTNCASCHDHKKGFKGSCTNCHGTEGFTATVTGADSNIASAPPLLVGPTTPVPNTAPAAQVTTGDGHRLHLNRTGFRSAPILCVDCHTNYSATHRDGSANVTWGTLAGAQGFVVTPATGALTATFKSAPNCTNWCHGSGLKDGHGTVATWAWNSTTLADCSSCHGQTGTPNVAMPSVATAHHPQNGTCVNCHFVDYATATQAARAPHINGTIEKPNKGCANCHGDLSVANNTVVLAGDPRAAPGYNGVGVDSTGVSVRTDSSVGAHANHIAPTMMSPKCFSCHATVADGNVTHANGVPAVAFDALSSTGVTAGYLSGSCTVYCHSSGVRFGATTATPRDPGAWTTNPTLTCASCHDAAPATLAHTKHVSASTYAIGCQACHAGTTDNGTSISGASLHVDGTNNVQFTATDPIWAPYVSGASYPTRPTCNTVYCHSSGTATAPTYAAPAWNAGAFSGCTQCHGGYTGATVMATGKHGNHVNNSALIGTDYHCDDCHATTVAGGATPTITYAGGKHVNRTRDVSIANRGTFASTDTTTTCSNTYCHSNGQRQFTTKLTVSWADAAWTAGTACYKCHGTSTTTGAPDYGATNQPDSATANSHAKHVTSSTDCATCHNGFVSAAGTAIAGASHTDGTINVAFDTGKAGTAVAFASGSFTAPSTYASATCSNVKCHGYNATTLKWGGPAQKCSDCHMGAADVDSFAFGTAGILSSTEWTGYGHGQSTFGGNTFPTVAAGTPCLYCHDGTVLHDVSGNPYRLRGATGAGGAVSPGNYSATTATSANQVCLNCHAVTGANGVYLDASNTLRTSTLKIDAAHFGAKHGAGTGGNRCWDCHDPHGDGTNKKMIGSKVVKASTDNHSWAATRVTGVTFTANATGTDYANASTSSLCRACHATAAHYNATTNDGHNSGSKCIACHAHEQAPAAAFAYATACNACHNAPPTLGKHAIHDETTFAETTYANNARHASATQYGFACNTCHNGTHMNGTGPYTAQVVFGSFDTTAVGGTYATGVAQTADTAPTGMLTFNWSNGSCSATYCHSNAAPVGGTNLAAAPTWAEAAWVKTGTTANECTKCHQVTADNPASAASTKLSHSHWLHVTTTAAGYYFNCSQCHNGVATGQSDYPASNVTSPATIVNKTLHVSGPTHTVAFDATVNPGTTSYTQGTSPTNPYTCSNTYCHSNGTNAATPPANISIAWNSATGTTCASCHAGYTGTIMATGKHTNHVNNAVIGTNYHCDDCHATTVGGGVTPTITYAGGKHVNRVKDVSIANRGTFASTDTTTTCSATYCHSSGQATPVYRTVTWADLAWTTVCNGCHGTGNSAGAPDYTQTGLAGGADANSHPAHTQTGATSCVTCHAGTVNSAGALLAGTAHTNGAREVSFSGLTGTPAYLATGGSLGAKQCNSVVCHGNNAIQWGAKLGCRGCHGAATGATVDDDVNDYTFTSITAPGTLSKIDMDDWVVNGHGSTSLSTESGNTAPDFDAAATKDGCVYCHDKGVTHGNANNFFRLANVGTGTTIAEKNGVCTVCHAGSGYTPPTGEGLKTASKQIGATHYGTKHSATARGGQLCWDCHDPHGDLSGTNRLAYMIQKAPVKTHNDATNVVTEWGLGTPTYAATPDFRKALGTSTTAWEWGDYVRNNGTPTAINGVCQVCHSTTTHFKSTTWTTAAIAPDTDWDANHNITGSPRCTGCHAHQQLPSNAFRASCTGCHGNKGTARTPATGADAMLEYAPPTDRGGVNTATTFNGVGAHISHVNQTTLRSQALACSQCHGASLPAAGHPNNAVAPISFGALATTGGITTATYTQGTGCSATYCHGNFKNGNYQLASLPAPTAAPTGLTFSNVTARSLTLKWTKVANAFVYKVERGLGATPATWAQIGTTTAASYADGGLGQNTTYSYRVSAWNLGGYGPTATASQLTNAAGAQSTVRYDLAPATAVNLTTDGSTTITTQTSYTWSTTTTPKGMGVANYPLNTTTQGRVYRNGTIAANSAYTAIMYTPALTTNPVNANLPISLDWVNRTTTTSGIGRFDATLYEYNDATGTVGQAKGTWSSPNLPQASASTTTWTTYSGTLNNPEFNITSGNRLKVVISYVTGATAPADACLLFGATESASATAGASRGNTFITPTFGIPTETVPTAAPTGLTVTGYEANSVTLSWGAVAGATSYKVERAPASTGPWAQVGKPTTTILTDGALTANTTYWYRVYASSAAGDGTAVAGPVSQLTRLPADGKPAWTGTFTSTTTLTCGSCHGDPPGGTHPSGTNCSLCHPGYGDWAATGQVIDPAQHINGVVNMTDDCTVCHATQVGDRRNVVAEFGMKWSHKRSAGGAVNKWDCIVCHMEGDPSTGLPRNGVAGGHMDGYVNLRDPDTGNNIQNVTWNMTTSPLGGTAAGSFGPGTGDATFMAFSRDLGVAFENDPNFLKVAAIQVNQCMKCHDTNGALAFTGTLPLSTMASQPAGTTRTQYIPFGTAVSYSAIATNEGGTTTAPSGTETAGGVAGGVIRLDASFATGNSSYHPVIGRNNNSFVYGTRAVAPWNTGITGRTAGSGSVNNYGYLMSCWDCHAANGTGSVPLTGTVTAHGGATTVRGKPYVTTAPSASNSVTLCKVCHAQYESSTDNAGHLTGSAIASSVNSPMGSTYMNYGCNMCHGSGYSVAVRRPIRAEDTHGTNTLSSLGTLNTLSGRWLADPRPFAFVRNRAAIGDHQPKAIGATTYTSAQCNMAGGGGESSICSNQGLKTYTPGGKF